MDAGTVPWPNKGSASRARGLELAGQLRAAVIGGDEVGITRLLSELLRVKGLTRGQRVTLQLRALQNMVQALRSTSPNDETTGLYNRRGFLQAGTRLLDVATRDKHPVHLVYMRLHEVQRIAEAIGASARDVLIRQMGNLLRDLFPDYGVYEILGRLSVDEFVALTPNGERASRQTILEWVRQSQRHNPTLQLSLGIAHFDPARSVGLDELLTWAKEAMHIREQIPRTASSGLAPQIPHDALLTVSRRRKRVAQGWLSNSTTQGRLECQAPRVDSSVAVTAAGAEIRPA
ncbi:MAG: GGDEF domain-containing protein [Gammaproteobacteria bacterium]|nr:GGDEF domain-containing protein [Gammaproteobacteria bacterium]